MEPLIIKDFPMSPSVNTMLMPVMGVMRRNKKGQVYAAGRMVKSKEHIEYAKLCNSWALKYQRGLDHFKEELWRTKANLEAQGIPFCLSIDAYYMFHVEHIMTKNGKVEQKDVDNLNKAALDNLCRILEIDDKHIFRINAEKCTTNQHECIIIKISPYKSRDISEIRSIFNLK